MILVSLLWYETLLNMIGFYSVFIRVFLVWFEPLILHLPPDGLRPTDDIPIAKFEAIVLAISLLS